MAGKKNKNLITRKRTAGVLMHITSLPGEYGIGTLGKEAEKFADFAKAAGFSYWQILPLVQTGLGNSPYQSVYTASGNPMMIDPEKLVAQGFLREEELAAYKMPQDGSVHFDELEARKTELLRKAFVRFDTEQASFKEFSSGDFLDYAYFMALRERSGGKPFWEWERRYKRHDAETLKEFYAKNADEVNFWLFVQYEFFREWKEIKAYANGLGIKIIGDIPLYVAYDSVDVWKNPQLFKLNKNLSCKKVAGVPPDYFSSTGQLWGNPVYDWKVHAADGYAWWTERIRQAFAIYDVVRIDHFRGFDRYYEIDAGAETAIGGRWRKGPGAALFAAVKEKLGELAFIAEDLGTLDEGVYRLMRKTGYPGMKVLQFAFDGNPGNPYLPANIAENSVCYTGTHDNDTLVGFIEGMGEAEHSNLLRILKPLLKEAGIEAETDTSEHIADGMEELALSCRAGLCVLPVQDLLKLGSDARMNVPSVAAGNWRFRLKEEMPSALAVKIREKLKVYKRV